MLKTCRYCGKIYDSKEQHHCSAKPKRGLHKDGERAVLFRNTYAWKQKREQIRTRDNNIDQAAYAGLDGEPYIEHNNLSVHHIVSLEDDYSLRLDDDNLITLSTRTHELAESGEIKQSDLRRIAHERNQLKLTGG